MAEYWKSLPRKFCDICKCWFADNKASIDFHERGKRHKENAQKRIQEIQKRGIKEFKKQKELENEMDKIEKAALAAYQKDLQNMQTGDHAQNVAQPTSISVSNKDSNFKTKASTKIDQKHKKVAVKKEKVVMEVFPEEPQPKTVWYEGESEDGQKYYWNSATSESQWEPPEEGYISIEEQNQVNPEPEPEQKEKSPVSTIVSIKEEKIDTEEICSVGPQPKVDPYGQWVTVVKKEPIQYDLQLPKPSEDTVEVVIPVHKDNISLKFKEKVIGQLTDSSATDVTFKKRKFTGSSRKNARQRTTDDD